MWRALAIACLLAAAAAYGADLEPTKDVEVALTANKAQFETGEPVLVTYTFRNVGRDIYSVEELHIPDFAGAFSVTDAAGNPVPDPYAYDGPRVIHCAGVTHKLPPGGQASYSRLLNHCVRFTKPGVYSVTAHVTVRREGREEYSVPVVHPLTLKVRAADPFRRAADIKALVAAYRSEGPSPVDLPFHNLGLDFGKRVGIVRTLAFFDDASLIPFFLDVMEGTDSNGFARDGLSGLSDRAAVLGAMAERLQHPEAHDVTKLWRLYARLAVRASGPHPFADTRALRRAVVDHCAARAMAFVRADREFRYPYLVPGLLGRGADQFLIEYLLRAKPDRDTLVRSMHAMNGVTLSREFIPRLEELARTQRDWDIADAAIRQLVRLDRDTYLPWIEADRPAAKHRFSPETYKLLPAAD